MKWNEVVIKCLEQRLRDEEVVKASLTTEILIQEKLVESIKLELKRRKE